IIKQVGDSVAVGEVIGTIGTEAGSVSTAPPSSNAASANGNTLGTSSTQQATPQQQKVATDTQRPPSPLARRIAAEHNVDITQIKGSSPHGRVTRDDVINYLEQNVQRKETVPEEKTVSTFPPLEANPIPQSPSVGVVPRADPVPTIQASS